MSRLAAAGGCWRLLAVAGGCWRLLAVGGAWWGLLGRAAMFPMARTSSKSPVASGSVSMGAVALLLLAIGRLQTRTEAKVTRGRVAIRACVSHAVSRRVLHTAMAAEPAAANGHRAQRDYSGARDAPSQPRSAHPHATAQRKRPRCGWPVFSMAASAPCCLRHCEEHWHRHARLHLRIPREARTRVLHRAHLWSSRRSTGRS